MKSNIKRTFLWLALGIFTFFVFTLSVNAQENKTKKVNKKEGMEEAKKIQRVYMLSPDYQNTSAVLQEKNSDSDSIVGTKTTSKEVK